MITTPVRKNNTIRYKTGRYSLPIGTYTRCKTVSLREIDLGFKAIEAGYSVIFISMNNLSQLLRTEAILSRSKAQMKRIRNCDLFT